MAFTNVYTTTVRGALTFTGNTAGLSQLDNVNLAGTVGSIGAFTSITLPTPIVGDFPTDSTLIPAGTTLNISDNGSAAILNIPPGSTVLHAELIWGGNFYGVDAGTGTVVDISGQINNPVTFQTPLSTSIVSGSLATAYQQIVTVPTAPFQSAVGFYTRSFNVTALVQAAGSGTYSVEQITGLVPVPAIGNLTSRTNHAGWTLAVAYSNPSLPYRNLNIYAGGIMVHPAASTIVDFTVSGFTTPSSGPITARLLVSAQEGDADIGGDQLLFGPNVGSLVQMSGPNNPITNFFGSQINNDSGLLDSTGTYGVRNQNPFTRTNISAGRQGWDITNIDASAQISYSQSSAALRLTTLQDAYMPDGVGIQIDAAVADLSVTKTASPSPIIAGNTLTYTINVTNGGEANSESTVLLFDTVPACMLSPQYSLDGINYSPWTGSVGLGTIAINASTIVYIRGRIDPACTSTLVNTAVAESAIIDPDPTNNTSTATVPLDTSADISVVKTGSPNPVIAGQTLTYTMNINNAGPSDSLGVTLADTAPPCLTSPQYSFNGINYIPWTGSISLGTLAANTSTIVFIRGLVDPTCTGTIVNTATVSSITPDSVPSNNTSTATIPLNTSADIRVVKTGVPSPAVPGQTLTYTMTVDNLGPSVAQTVTLADAIPACMLSPQYSFDGTNYTPWTGNLSLGNMAVNASTIVFIRGLVDPVCTGTIVNTATVNSVTPDSIPSNNTSTVTIPLAPDADISVVKTGAPNPGVAGQTLTYTMNINNAGPSVAQSVTLADAIPACLTSPQYSFDGTNYTPWTGSVNLGNMSVNASTIVFIRGIIDPVCTGTIVNTATVTSVTPDRITTNNTSTVSIPLNVSADISVIKTGTPNPATAGQTLTYTMNISNAGPAVAQTVTLADAIPACLTSPQYSFDGTNYTPWTGSVNLGDMAVNASTIVFIRGLVDPTCTGNIVNTATISSVTPDPTPANNTSTATIPLDVSADVSVVKTGAPSPATAGQTLTYTMNINNAGPAVAQSVTLADAIPACMLSPQYSFDGTNYTPWTGNINLGNMAVNASTVVFIRGLVDPACTGTIVNTAIVNSITPDSVPNNNTSTATIPLDTSADIRVVKTGVPSPAVPGQTLTYTMTVDNLGPSVAQSVTLADAIPACLTSPQYSFDGTNYTPWTGNLSLGNMAVNASTIVFIRGLVDPVCTGTIANTATVNSVTPDPTPANNTSTVTIPLAPDADISVVKTGAPNPGVAGQTLTYTMNINNAGPSVAQTVTLADAIPACLTSPQYSFDGTNYIPWTGSVNLGNMAVNASTIVFIRGLVDPTCTGNIVNTATVTSVTPDRIINNNTSTVTVPLNASADISVVKTGAPNPGVAGQTLTYTMTVDNLGPSVAQSVTLADAIPACMLSPQYSFDGINYTPWTGSINLGNMAVNASTIVFIRGLVDPVCTGNITNTATVNSVTPDPTPANNTSTVTVPLNASADISVVKTGNPTPVVAGQTLTYTMNINNAGPSVAQTVTLADAIPACMLSPQYSFDGTNYTPWTGNINLGNMAVNASTIVFIRGLVDPVCTGNITNTATVNSVTPDPTPANNTSTVTVPLNASADISVVKTGNPTPVVAGQTLTYTMNINNAGPSVAQTVTLADAIPACMLSPQYSFDGTNYTPWTGNINLGNMAVNASTIVFIRGLVDPVCTGTIANTATVNSVTPDPTPANNTSTVTVPLNASADISVVKTGNPTPVVAGQTLTYTMNINNAGPSVAQSVTLADAIPACLTSPQYSFDGTNYTPWTGNINLGNMAVNASTIVFIRGLVDPVCTGTIANTATVNSVTPDPTPANNTSTVTIPLNASADISVVKTGNPTPVVAGQTLTYTMNISNAGPSVAQSVTLADAIPACMLSPQYSFDGTNYTPWTGNINLGNMAVNASTIVFIRGLVDPACTGNIANTATVNSVTPDPTPANNTSTVTVPLNTSADVSVVKSGNPSPVVAGQTLTYSMSINNAGPSVAQSVTLADAIPACMVLPQYSFDGTNYTPWTGNINLGNMAVNASTIVFIRGLVDPACTGNIANTATVNSVTPDPTPANNISTVTVPLNTSANISVVKTGNPTPVVAGQTLTYTMNISNAGPSVAQSVTLADAIPACMVLPQYSFDGTNYTPWTGSINVGNIIVNASTIVYIRGLVDPACTGSIANTAIINSVTPDSTPSNNTSTVTVPISTSADIKVVKSSNVDFATSGNVVIYTMTVSNLGPSNANNVLLTDSIPPQIQNPQYSLDGINYVNWTGSINIGTIAVNTSKTVYIKGTVSQSAIGDVVNTATITSPTPDPDPTNNNSTKSVSVEVVKLDNVKSVDKPYADVGETITYTLSFKNNGNTTANNVVIIDTIPNGTSLVIGSIVSNVGFTGGNPQTGISITNGIAPNQTVTVSYKVIVNEIPTPNPIPNQATINYTYTVDPTNPNSESRTENTNTVTTQVNHGEISPNNAIKASSKNPTTPGDTITYTVTLKNTGNVPVNNVVIKDVLPLGTTFVAGSVTIGGVSKPNENPNLGIKVGTIPPNSAIVTTFKVVVLPGAPSVLTNQANVDYNYIVDPAKPPTQKEVPTNKVDVNVLVPSIKLVKSSNRDGAAVGENIRYSIVVTNNGQIDLSNVVVKDPLVPQLKFNDTLTIDNVANGQDITTGVNIGTLNIGQSKTIAFNALVISVPPSGIAENKSSATYDYTVTGSNFSSSGSSNIVDVRIFSPKLDIVKTPNKHAVKVGDTFEYTILVENTGDIAIDNVIVTDTLPAEFNVVNIKLDGSNISGNLSTGINIGTIDVNQTKTLVVTIKVLADRDTTFKNVVIANGTATTSPGFPPIPVDATGRDNIGVDVYNPKLDLVKSVDKKYVAVGDTVTYTIKATNSGDLPLGNIAGDPVLVYDILAPDLAFIEGSVKVDGVIKPAESILSGINLGVMNIGEIKTITFEVKVISKTTDIIENHSTATFGYQLPGSQPENGGSISNIVNVIPLDVNIDVVKTSDKTIAVLGDTITYTVKLTNTGDLDVTNVLFKDVLPKEVELINGSFTVNGKVINNVDLSSGVNIGTIAKNSTTIVQYSVKVVAPNCSMQIVNSVTLQFSYVFPDGTIGSKVTDPTSTSTNTLDMGITNFKQFSIQEYLMKPAQKPGMEAINNVKGEVKVARCHVIETSKNTSSEGQNVTQYKLIVHGVLREVIEYTACNREQSVHSAHYDIPFTTFIVLPNNYVEGSKLDIDPVVEDIYSNLVDCDVVFTNATVLINVKILSC